MAIPDGWVYPTGNFLVRTGFRVFADLRVEGREAVPPFGPLIIVANHLSFVDPALLAAVIPRRLHYLAKRDVFRTAFIRFILRGYRAFPVDRNGRDVAGFRWALNRLQQDQVLALFPEGSRSRDCKLRKPLPGVVQLHLRTQAPILPVAITGTQRLQSIPRIFFPSGKITVIIGAPFSLPMLEGRLAKAQVEALGDMMMQRVADLLPESYRGVYARSPL